jgi:hypothetical protein
MRRHNKRLVKAMIVTFSGFCINLAAFYYVAIYVSPNVSLLINNVISTIFYTASATYLWLLQEYEL